LDLSNFKRHLVTHTYINLGLLWRGPVKHLNIRGWLQVEAIDQTLGAILTDLGDVYDAFMILWWRVLSGACLRLRQILTCSVVVGKTSWTVLTPIQAAPQRVMWLSRGGR